MKSAWRTLLVLWYLPEYKIVIISTTYAYMSRSPHVGRASSHAQDAIPLKSPCACRLSRRPPLTQVIELRLGLSKGSALQAEPLAMRSKALPFLSQVLRWSVTQGPQ